MTIEWIAISTKYPIEHKDYLVQYNEYIGITIIIGWKIAKWDGNFPSSKRQLITHYADIPEYFYENYPNLRR